MDKVHDKTCKKMVRFREKIKEKGIWKEEERKKERSKEKKMTEGKKETRMTIVHSEAENLQQSIC